MTRSFMWAPLVLLTAALPTACLLPGPEALLERATAEVIVTGVQGGDLIRIEVGDVVRETTVDDDVPLHLHLELPPGVYEGSLEVVRQQAHLCARVLLEIPEEDAQAVTSVDLRDAQPCQGDVVDGGPVAIDTGLVHLRTEEYPGGCDGNGCLSLRITVDSSGSLGFTEGGESGQAEVPEEDLRILAEQAMSAEADVLFAGEDPACLQPRPEPSEQALLERRHRPTQ